ncbi:hypothetical protein K523DRAFT_412905 [Schizophyllum commune Tattone D]|nr:hypothetical protein K523DRAFT_412905 [Schizophyllum commune Tattone D]
MSARWRTNPVVANELCYSTVVEKFLNIAMPARAEWIRTPLGETTLTLSARLPAPFQRDYSLPFGEIIRILNYLMATLTHVTDVGPLTLPLWGFEEREKLVELCEREKLVELHERLHRPPARRVRCAHVRSGGVATAGASTRSKKSRDPEAADDRIWKRRTINVGQVVAEDAQRISFSGGTLRGNGVPCCEVAVCYAAR